MSFAPNHDLITVTARGIDLAGAAERLRAELSAYPNARIVSMTQQTNMLTSFSGKTTLVAAIEYGDTETTQ